MSLITVQEVVTEFVKKGPKGYNVATVTYTDNGKNFTKKVMSFANPAVFDAIKTAKQGDTYEVKVVKDGEYYNWAQLTPANAEGGGGGISGTGKAMAPGGGKVLGSTYETADERKIKQLYIIKQSSISNAIEYLSSVNNEEPASVEYVLTIAQKFVDFVYGTEELVADATHE